MRRHSFDPLAFLTGVAVVVVAATAWSGDLASNINNGRWIAPLFVVSGIIVTVVALQRHRRRTPTNVVAATNRLGAVVPSVEPDSTTVGVVPTTTSDWQ
jgi:hypothetical protein